jgi:hypothetical protein
MEEVGGGEAGEEPRGERMGRGEGRATDASIVVAAEDWATVVGTPPVHVAPAQLRTVATSNAEAVKVTEDGSLADQSTIMQGEMGD